MLDKISKDRLVLRRPRRFVTHRTGVAYSRWYGDVFCPYTLLNLDTPVEGSCYSSDHNVSALYHDEEQSDSYERPPETGAIKYLGPQFCFQPLTEHR